jgi:hypothetical protein
MSTSLLALAGLAGFVPAGGSAARARGLDDFPRRADAMVDTLEIPQI